jgi:cellulose synthase/poly-beta-1,6-N-acetylglucosamine synthase-like glycosyltransferase
MMAAATPIIAALAWYVFLACIVYLLAIVVIFALMLIMAVRENRLQARQSQIEDFNTLLSSPFTIPVSIIAPAFNEEVCVTSAVRSLLALRYPEYEVIVVNDGSKDQTLARLQQDFDLEPTGTFYRKTLPSHDINQIYRSRTNPRLLVVDKVNGGKADALNCGINLARYRYVCCVDGDTVYESDALLKGMRLINHDPAIAVGVTSQISLHRHPEQATRVENNRMRLDRHMLTTFQMFDYLRAFVAARLAWSRGNYMLCAVGAFAIWRRDVLLELGGFSKDFTCEDIEFTFRVHEHFRSADKPYRVYSLADPIAVTEGPDTVRALVSQRARWQRVITESVWHYRRMLLNRKYGTVGMIGMPYYVLAEVLAPVFQILAIISVPLAAAAGLLRWEDFVRIIVILAFGGALFTNVALLVQERTLRRFAVRDLPYLILLGPLELLLYRPVIFYAQFKGAIDFLRGDRGWHKFQRNRR